MSTAPSLSNALLFSQLAYDDTGGSSSGVATPAGFVPTAFSNWNDTGLKR